MIHRFYLYNTEIDGGIKDFNIFSLIHLLKNLEKYRAI